MSERDRPAPRPLAGRLPAASSSAPASTETELVASLRADLAASQAHAAELKDALATSERNAELAQLEAAARHAVVAAEIGQSESDAESQQQHANAARLEAAARHAAVAVEVEDAEQQAERSRQAANEATVRGGLMQAELGATERSLADADAAARTARIERLAEQRSPAMPMTSTSAVVLLRRTEGRTGVEETTGPSGVPPEEAAAAASEAA